VEIFGINIDDAADIVSAIGYLAWLALVAAVPIKLLMWMFS
jgi:hypothetical protein